VAEEKKNENQETQDESVAEAAEEQQVSDTGPVSDTGSSDEAPAEEAVAEAEPPAEEAPAEEQPVEEAPAEEQPAEEEAPVEEAPAEEPAEEAPAAEAEGEQPAPAAEGADSAPAAMPERKPKPKRKPRSERRRRSKPTRERPETRKAITRLPKPEQARGRRQERRGIVVSSAMDKTIVVKVETVKAHSRYKKVIRRSRKFHAHDEQNVANVGDIVRIVETRPLSATKNWRLVEVVEAAK
jgi:small subunit ribosomal protein S17